MTSLVLEDGSIVAGSNTFITAQNLVDYAADRGITILLADAPKWIWYGNDYILSQTYKGDLVEDTQTMPFPRDNLYIDCELQANDIVPDKIIKASLEAALASYRGVNLLGDVKRATKEKQLGPMKIVYQDNASDSTIVQSVDIWLVDYVEDGGNMSTHFNIERVY